ncbi:MAG: putative lipid II flippase FtsW [Actinomycetota bacterium]
MATETRDRHLRLVPTGDRATRPNRRKAERTIRMLLASTTFLVFTGLLMVLSSSSITAYAQYGSGFLFFLRQLAYTLFGIGALFLTSRMRYEVWQRLAGPLLALTVLLLGIVLHPAAGHEVAGSSRWIGFGPITIQPSELAKLSLTLYAAAYLGRRGGEIREVSDLVTLLVVTAGIGAFVMMQPDLGTTLIIVGTVFLVLFAAGAPLRYLGTIGVVGLAAGVGLIFSADYRRERLLAFLHPWEDPGGRGFQLIQSLIAFGSGGITGVGLGASRQKWFRVPNAHTDFIFAIIGEELGLVGSIVVLIGYGLLLFAGVRVAIVARDAFGRILAAGIVSWFGIQALVNLGAVTGLLPITGVPLPFVSYGGSSLIVSLAAVGILVNIAKAAAKGETPAPARRRRSRAA